MTIGDVESTTVTVCVSKPVLTDESIALQVMIVSPKGYGPTLSGNGVNIPSTLSDAVATPNTTVVNSPVDSTVISAGAITSGGVVSRTITLCVAEPILPAASVTLQVTVFDPNAKGPVLFAIGVNTPSTLSVAVAVP